MPVKLDVRILGAGGSKCRRKQQRVSVAGPMTPERESSTRHCRCSKDCESSMTHRSEFPISSAGGTWNVPTTERARPIVSLFQAVWIEVKSGFSVETVSTVSIARAGHFHPICKPNLLVKSIPIDLIVLSAH